MRADLVLAYVVCTSYGRRVLPASDRQHASSYEEQERVHNEGEMMSSGRSSAPHQRSPLKTFSLQSLLFKKPTAAWQVIGQHLNIDLTHLAPLHSIPLASPRAHTLLGKKKKKKQKSSFVPYKIDGEYSLLFPLPDNRHAVGLNKKDAGKGVKASKVTENDCLHEKVPDLDLEYPGLKVMHLDPPVFVIDNFFSDIECDEYLALQSADESAVYQLEQSATFGSTLNDARTSTTWFVSYQNVPNFLARAAALLGVNDIARFEEPQLVRYQQGQFFKWHYDAVPPTQLFNGGQRVATLLVYLNDVPTGGRTAFRDLRTGDTDRNFEPIRLEVAPKKGRAILFFPAAADGTPDERTLHAGSPTEAGEEKWIAQLWLHQEPYQPTVPKESSHAKAAPAVHAFAEKHSLRQIVVGDSPGQMALAQGH